MRHIHTTKRSVVVIVTIWLFSTIVVSPQIVFQRLRVFLKCERDGRLRMAFMCVEHFFDDAAIRVTYTLLIFGLFYVLPLVIMLLAYGAIIARLRRRKPVGEAARNRKSLKKNVAESKSIIRMLITVVVCFAVAWLPFFGCQIYLLFNEANSDTLLVMAVFHLVGYSNTCVNPIIYCFMSSKFRSYSKQTFSSQCSEASGAHACEHQSSNRLTSKASLYSRHAAVDHSESVALRSFVDGDKQLTS